MKNRIIYLLVIIVPMTGFCQPGSPDGKATDRDNIRFGIKAGIAIANSTTKYNPSVSPGDVQTKSKIGGLSGVFVRMTLGHNAVFQPELLLAGKGSKQQDQYYTYSEDRTYLELPLNVLYKPSISKGAFFIGGGLAPAYFIGESVFVSDDGFIKKFDLGLNVLAVYELPIGFSINLNYCHGLLNVSNNKSYFSTIRNRYFGLTIGYVF